MVLETGSVNNSDLTAVLEPVMGWYQSDEHPQRDLLEILRDVVSDLQTDRATALAGVADKRRLDFMDAHPLPTEVHGGCDDGHQGTAWAIATHSGSLRYALDAWMSHEASIARLRETADGGTAQGNSENGNLSV